MLDEDLEMMRAAALLVSAGHCGSVRPTREQAETMAKGLVELADEVRRLKGVLRAIADPMSFKHRGTPLALCRIYEDMAAEALGSNVELTGRQRLHGDAEARRSPGPLAVRFSDS